MFFRIFWFKRKQRPAPSSTPRSAKASTRLEPLSLAEHPASTPAQDPAPGSLSPIIFVNRDPKPVSSYAGRVRISANSGSGMFSPRPGMPRKKRHVSFVVIESGAEARLASSPPTPYPFLSSISPSSSRLNRESFSSASTLVDADQHPPKPSAVDTLAWEDILDKSVSSAAGVCTDTGAQTRLPSATGRDKARVKSRHISMLPSSPKRPKASRFSAPVPPRGGLMPQTPYIPSGSSINTPPLSRRMSRRISVMSTASRSGSVRVNKSKRASRWSQHVNSPETQEVLKALRDMS
ncbi:hypothetical protein EDC04DRAFT_2082850 [Pisolithus marmoratus]|nr:hypothetical protein EDC04DRAFT_2082850 [Pisolithus marmoratus]